MESCQYARLELVEESFDNARVAIVAGYKVLYNGATGEELARIPLSGITNPGTRTISPMGVVTGNCGTSYLYLQNLGGLRYQFSTGFDLSSSSAFDFDWYLTVTDKWIYPYSGYPTSNAWVY